MNAKLEHGLEVVGSTAIEDRLQEEVPETIIALKSVGVKVWVLTGDKVETAVNIGFSAGLLNNEMKQHLIDSVDIEGIKDQMKTAKESISTTKNLKQAVVISGDSLTKMESNYEILGQFLDICESVDAVLACRVSPLQKGEIVSLVKARKPNKITLAIGDGANDVAMIMKAHVGVGIAGREGM